jgi:hypothetical protein
MIKMKLMLSLTLIFFAFSSIAQSDHIWTVIKDAPLIDSKNATSIKSYENTLESVVTYFYASRIRKDQEWQKVVLATKDQSERLKNQLKTYDEWTITKFHLVSKTEFQPGRYWVKVYFEIEMDGDVEDGTDEAEVKLIDGKWVITEVPT